jgi:hypothetical protein
MALWDFVCPQTSLTRPLIKFANGSKLNEMFVFHTAENTTESWISGTIDTAQSWLTSVIDTSESMLSDTIDTVKSENIKFCVWPSGGTDIAESWHGSVIDTAEWLLAPLCRPFDFQKALYFFWKPNEI